MTCPRDELPPLVIGTAGHVDHGKTALTRALTGVDTDRLKEEKERGLSIELGFAPFRLTDGRAASLVDVPGHERFIKNMAAGVSGMDLVILVVAADEGVMPQTREHLDILSLLGVRLGFVALTKTDLVDQEWREMIAEDIAKVLQGTPLEGAPIIPCSAKTGEGLDAVINQVQRLAAQAPGRDPDSPFMMPIDRSFTMQGFGTVVTGTVARGRVEVGEELEVLPVSRGVRVRSLQVHGEAVPSVRAGQRAAVNLQGIHHEEVVRGDLLAQPGSLRPTSMIDAEVHVLPSSPVPLEHWDRVRVHLGAAEIIARVVVLGESQQVPPGGSGFVQLRLETPTATDRGCPFVLRTYSPATTFAGGRVVDPSPRKHRGRDRRDAEGDLRQRSEAAPAELLELAATRAGRPLESSALFSAAGLQDTPTHRAVLERLVESGALCPLPGGLLVASPLKKQARDSILAALRRHHEKYPLRPGMDRAELRTHLASVDPVLLRVVLADLVQEGEVVADGSNSLRLQGHVPTFEEESQVVADRLLQAATEAGFVGLSSEEAYQLVAEDPREVLAHLVHKGDLVLVGGRYLHRATIDRVLQAVREHFRERSVLRVSELRDRLGSSRKAVVPLLEYLDAEGYTVRRGEERVAGPKGKPNE